MFLPVAARELIVAARRKTTWRTRALAAGIALLLFWWRYESIPPFMPGSRHGWLLFSWMVGICWTFCITSGLWATSDTMSVERREGTLGLLFLTPLKNRDIVFGKLAAGSLSAFYSAFAIAPVLALPVMMGGITGMQLFKSILLLFTAMGLSLSAGICVSTLNILPRKAIFYTIVLLLALCCLPFFLAYFVVDFFLPTGIWTVLAVSPLFSVFDLLQNTGFNKDAFWFSISISNLVALLLLCLANRYASVSRLASEPLASPKTALDKPIKQLSNPSPRHFLDINPFLWLACRDQQKTRNVWFFVVAILLMWSCSFVAYGMVAFEPGLMLALVLAMNGFLKFWIISETVSRVIEDKKNGAFELLLSTPLQERDILKGIALSLKAQFWRPIVALILFESLPLVVFHGDMKNVQYSNAYQYYTILAAVALLVADAIAIYWVGLAIAMRVKSYPQAIMLTATIILVLPTVAWFFKSKSGIYSEKEPLWYLASCLAWNAFLMIFWAIPNVRSRFKWFLTEQK